MSAINLPESRTSPLWAVGFHFNYPSYLQIALSCVIHMTIRSSSFLAFRGYIFCNNIPHIWPFLEPFSNTCHHSRVETSENSCASAFSVHGPRDWSRDHLCLYKEAQRRTRHSATSEHCLSHKV